MKYKHKFEKELHKQVDQIGKKVREIEAIIPNEKIQDSDKQDYRSRKDFFVKSYRSVAGIFLQHVEGKINKITGHQNRFIRPPGAIPEKEFLQTCTRCKSCAEACPNHAIRIADQKQGILNLDFPFLDVQHKPCIVCQDVPCSQVCPSGALIPIDQREIFLGKAEIDEKRCLAYQGEKCFNCDYSCPIKGTILWNKEGPRIDPLSCVGCGICIFACVTDPPAVKFISKKENFPSFRLYSSNQQ